MEIIDAQIHEPAPPKPLGSQFQWKELELLVNTELAREAMDAIGVDRALINAPQPFLDVAVGRYPDRFAGCGFLDHRAPNIDEQVAAYRDKPGMLATRTIIDDWRNDVPSDDFAAGKVEPLFAACEKHHLPLFCLTHHAHQLAPIAQKHPDLLLVIDHLGLPQPPPIKRDPDPWQRLPGVISMAKYPNVAVKLSGAITLSLKPFPHADMWLHLHKLIDAFGPDRLMWGSDFTRLRWAPLTTLEPGPREGWVLYSDSLNYLRDTDEVSDSDKAAMFAGTIRRLLRWPETP
jgi:predicted TIM-barrel fold metal-dependent hydrolase